MATYARTQGLAHVRVRILPSTMPAPPISRAVGWNTSPVTAGPRRNTRRVETPVLKVNAPITATSTPAEDPNEHATVREHIHQRVIDNVVIVPPAPTFTQVPKSPVEVVTGRTKNRRAVVTGSEVGEAGAVTGKTKNATPVVTGVERGEAVAVTGKKTGTSVTTGKRKGSNVARTGARKSTTVVETGSEQGEAAGTTGKTKNVVKVKTKP